MAEFTDENGNLGRPVPSGTIVVPAEVWLDGESLSWRIGQSPRYRQVTRDMINDFVRLSEPASILAFAKDWGLLAMGKGDFFKRGEFVSRTFWSRKRLYGGRRQMAYMVIRPLGNQILRPGRESVLEGSEPIAAWQYYARRAHAVLHIAASLKEGGPGERRHWDEISVAIPDGLSDDELENRLSLAAKHHKYGLGFTMFHPGADFDRRIEFARGFVTHELGYWHDCWKRGRTVDLSDFVLRWRDEPKPRWDLEIEYHGLLFPAIALQLMLVVANASGLYCCSGCGTPYIRARDRRSPKRGCANYCDECRNSGVAQRRAVETYRAKKAEAQQKTSD